MIGWCVGLGTATVVRPVYMYIGLIETKLGFRRRCMVHYRMVLTMMVGLEGMWFWGVEGVW